MKIEWKWVSMFIQDLAKREHDLLIAEYDVREKWGRRTWLTGTPEERDFTFQSIPVIQRVVEQYICPKERFWERRYYKSLFDGDDRDMREKVCINYLEGLEWVFKYYTVECPDWKWKYCYHYPPLLSDLALYIPKTDHSFIDDLNNKDRYTPFTPSVQLAYVLPFAYHDLLPIPMRQLLKEKYSSMFAETFTFQWAFCRYFWESHVLLPEIGLDTLEEWNKG
jgi:5'-3' exonuclease